MSGDRQPVVFTVTATGDNGATQTIFEKACPGDKVTYDAETLTINICAPSVVREDLTLAHMKYDMVDSSVTVVISDDDAPVKKKAPAKRKPAAKKAKPKTAAKKSPAKKK